MLLHESLGPWEKKKKKWIQNPINTPQSFMTPMSGLDDTETTTMIAFLLLALVAHSLAVPLPSRDKDDLLLAEVRAEVSHSDRIQSFKLVLSCFCWL